MVLDVGYFLMYFDQKMGTLNFFSFFNVVADLPAQFYSMANFFPTYYITDFVQFEMNVKFSFVYFLCYTFN